MSEALRTLAERLAGETEHDVEIVDGCIYVNFDHLRAVVIERSLADSDAWSIEAYEWDVAGGVRDTVFMGVVRERWVAVLANAFITGYETVRDRAHLSVVE